MGRPRPIGQLSAPLQSLLPVTLTPLFQLTVKFSVTSGACRGTQHGTGRERHGNRYGAMMK